MVCTPPSLSGLRCYFNICYPPSRVSTACSPVLMDQSTSWTTFTFLPKRVETILLSDACMWGEGRSRMATGEWSCGQQQQGIASLLKPSSPSLPRLVVYMFFFASRLLRELSEMDRKHYPGRGGVIYVINTPPLFGLVWQGIRGFLSTQVKIDTPPFPSLPLLFLCGHHVAVSMRVTFCFDERPSNDPPVLYLHRCTVIRSRIKLSNSRVQVSCNIGHPPQREHPMKSRASGFVF